MRDFLMSLLRLCFWIRIILLASLAMPMSQALAQRGQMSIVDQPGLIPDPADEQLSSQFQRQIVLYRTT